MNPNSQPKALRLPPFAKRHAIAARAGFAPREGIIVVGSWFLKRCLDWHPLSWHALVPDNEEASAFDWRWCAGFRVLVLAPKRATARLDAIASTILASGAAEVFGTEYAGRTFAYTPRGYLEIEA